MKDRLLVVFYATPDEYPPTYSAIAELVSHFDIQVVCREKSDASLVSWPNGVVVQRVGPGRSEREQYAASRIDKLTEFFRFVAAVGRSLREQPPQIVIAYEPHALVALRLAGCRVPVVYHRHEIEDLERIDRRSLSGWILWMSLRLSEWPQTVVFPESARADYYSRFARVRHPPVIVPNFPRLATFPAPPSWPHVFEQRAARREVLFRGVVSPENGAREAVKMLAKVDAKIQLRLCGRACPDFRAELEAIALESHVRDRIALPGYVAYETLNRQSLDSSLGLALYHFSGSNPRLENAASASNKIYEYAACGLPTLVPDKATFRAFLGAEPWVTTVDPTDVEAVAHAVTGMLDTPEAYEARAQAARRAFESRFNFEAAFAPLLETMKQLARPTSGAGRTKMRG